MYTVIMRSNMQIRESQLIILTFVFHEVFISTICLFSQVHGNFYVKNNLIKNSFTRDTQSRMYAAWE